MYLINKRTRIDAKGAKICLPLKTNAEHTVRIQIEKSYNR